MAALELSNGSNGWFRFILDGKLATMYSSGSPEGGSDSSGRSSYIRYVVVFIIVQVLPFLPRCSMQGGLSDRVGVRLSVRLSVRPSVTA